MTWTPSEAGSLEGETRAAARSRPSRTLGDSLRGLAGFDASQVDAELETLEMMGCVHRLPSLTGARWIILEKGKEALNA